MPNPSPFSGCDLDYLQVGSVLGLHGGGGGVLVSQEKSDSWSLPGRLVDAESSVPDPVQLKCWVLFRTLEALTVHVSPDDQAAVRVPAAAPPVWLLTKCQVPENRHRTTAR